MANLIYWMVFQILVGIWLFASPYVLQDSEVMSMTTHNMIFGAVVVLLGLGMALFSKEVCAGIQHPEKRTT
jgi:Na+/melibiose symporter-like transporter